jgi:hypothetical protein
MKDIFISYSRKDTQVARLVEKRLETEGWTVFRDDRIPTGSEWHKVIVQEAERAICVVVLWSENSIGSEWVLEEAAIGLRRGVLLPIFLDTTMPPYPFPSIQGGRHLAREEEISESPAMSNLVWSIAMKCGSKQLLAIYPLELFIVVGWERKWKNLGPTINMYCRFENKMERTVKLSSLKAIADGPYTHPLEFSLNSPYVVDGETKEQLRRDGEDNSIRLSQGELECGVQLQAPK